MLVLSVFAGLDIAYRVLVIILGLLGNAATIVLIPLNSRLRTWENAFHMLLSILDLLLVTIAVPIGIQRVLYADDVLDPTMLCVEYVVYTYCFVVNIVILSDIAVLRCYRMLNMGKTIPTYVFIFGILSQVMAGLVVTLSTIFSRSSGTCFPIPDVGGISNTSHMTKGYGGDHSGSEEAEWENYHRVMLVIFLLCIALKMVISYSKIIRYITHTRRNINPAIPEPRANVVISSSQAPAAIVPFVISTFGQIEPYDAAAPHMDAKRRALHYLRTMAINSAIVIAIFIFSFLPVTFARMLQHFNWIHLAPDVESLLGSIALTSSYMNPYMYTLRNGALKSQIHKLQRKFCL